MKVYINSSLKEIPETVDSVKKLLEFLHYPINGTGVGINNHLIKAAEWDTVTVKEDDHVVIITASFGG